MLRFATARCQVRPFEEGDLDAFTACHNDAKWMRYQGFKNLSRDQYTEVLLREHLLDDGIQLAAINRHTAQFIGDLYLRRQQDTCWLGYTVCPEHARQGYAAELVTALIDQLRALGFARLCAGVLPKNTASIALLRKLGFAWQRRQDDEDIYVLSLSSPPEPVE